MTEHPSNPPRIFDKDHRTLTIGILLGVTLVAFEALAVVTIAPRISVELGGTHLYGWIFSGLLLTSLLGTVLGGQMADRSGPGRVILLGIAVFGLGLIVGAAAGAMPVLIVGRLLQGLGGGAMVTALYAVVNLAYNDAMRPSLFAAMSSAWVVPGLVGPLLAAFVASHVGWRAVFWGLLPLLVLVALLTVPAFGRFPKPEPRGGANPLTRALQLTLGTGLFLAGLTVGTWWGVLLLVVGGPLAFFSLRALLPAGTLAARAGLPAVVASRALFYSAFAGVEAFVAYMLTRIHHYDEVVASVVIATGALSWASGSFLQARLDNLKTGEEARSQRVRLGVMLISFGLTVQLAALVSPVLSLAISVAGWALAGLGMGLAHATTSVLAFAAAPEGEGGSVSASLQLADQFSSALSAGIGGALLALATRLGFSDTVGVAWADIFCLALVYLALVTMQRLGSAKNVSGRALEAGGER